MRYLIVSFCGSIWRMRFFSRGQGQSLKLLSRLSWPSLPLILQAFFNYRNVSILNNRMDPEEQEKQCTVHKKPFEFICLDEDCSEKFLLCKSCKESSVHKHSKTTIEVIAEVKQKLKETWELKDSKIKPYYKKVRQFYDRMRKDLTELLNEDQKIVEALLQKITYHHLPIEASSLAYLEFKKQHYERIDKASILKLISEAENGELNKNLNQQTQIMKLMDHEMSKLDEKLMTVQYVMLSKSMQIQLLSPKMSEPSKVCQNDEFIKIYALFNSKNLLIRHAKLLHRGSASKFSHKDFLNACNNTPNCMAMVKLENGRKVGGFSAMPLANQIEDAEFESKQTIYEVDRSSRSFIFSITNIGSYELLDKKKAVGYTKGACGPMFGPDLDLSDKVATSAMGHSYQPPHGMSVDSLESRVILLGAAKVPISELQIWQLSF